MSPSPPKDERSIAISRRKKALESANIVNNYLACAASSRNDHSIAHGETIDDLLVGVIEAPEQWFIRPDPEKDAVAENYEATAEKEIRSALCVVREMIAMRRNGYVFSAVHQSLVV